jgi:ribosomal protein L13
LGERARAQSRVNPRGYFPSLDKEEGREGCFRKKHPVNSIREMIKGTMPKNTKQNEEKLNKSQKQT